jgi:hypothetical protein
MRDGFSEREIVYKAEDLILRLRDVRSCRIITDETGAISEIHVVASSDRPPKFIARDVETALKAELGLEVDYRKIGVVMMDPGGAGEDEPTPDEKPFTSIDGGSVSTDELVDERFAEAGPGFERDRRSPEESQPLFDRSEFHPSESIFGVPVQESPPEPVTTTVHLPLPRVDPHHLSGSPHHEGTWATRATLCAHE